MKYKQTKVRTFFKSDNIIYYIQDVPTRSVPPFNLKSKPFKREDI